ncbi:hypothetical protein J3R82DRAFT_3543 [Butyriboletus roseoflavus]|nr:hypothetical protein J3R82DRAFT_3543 [Butyriboletus roseoflavus]
MKNKFGTKTEEHGKDLRDTLVFGAGRRICPGMHIAEHTMELTTLRLLWAFDFHPVRDQVTAQPIELDIEDYTSTITLAPRPFRCQIVPRSPHRARVIRRSFADATNTLKLFEDGLRQEEIEELHSLREGQEISFE